MKETPPIFGIWPADRRAIDEFEPIDPAELDLETGHPGLGDTAYGGSNAAGLFSPYVEITG